MMRLRRHNVADNTPAESSPPSTNLRRSTRLSKLDRIVPVRVTKPNDRKPRRKMSQAESTASEPRRNAKRKAALSPQVPDVPNNLLEEALKPLDSAEIEDWGGWIELESEPAFFNTILKHIGVKDVKVQELFTLDQDSLDILPKPVFGLIFLFQYSPFLDDGEFEDEGEPVWFANQTTSNACATVALLNIVMNHDTIDLGSELQNFRKATENMSSAIRGYELSRNKFIRKTHNSFARRMDCLNADLFLETEASNAKSRKRSYFSRSAPTKKTKAKKRKDEEYGFHFIAYVPSGDSVWELDGLRGKPRKLGPLNGSDWTALALPQIQARMLQYEESQLSFNLVSICQSPLREYRRSVQRALATLHYFDEHIIPKHSAADAKIASVHKDDYNPSNAVVLSEFGLSPEDAGDKSLAYESVKEAAQNEKLGPDEVVAMRRDLVVELRASMGEYRSEVSAANVDEERVTARKKDYGSALHKWVTKLAEKGVLEEMAKLSA